ncbi:DMT family transporter [[Eubacterium] cellulosolvens]
MTNNRHLTPTTFTFILISVILWGWAFPIIKVTLDFVPPLAIGYFRYLFASLPFIGYLFYKHGVSETLAVLKNGWWIIFALAITMVTIPNIAQNIGLLYTTSSVAALISTAAPVFTVIIAIIILKESKNLLKILGLVIALFASIMIVFQTGFEISDATMFGNTLIFITAVSYGVCGPIGKMALKKFSPVYVVGFSMFIGSVLLIPISIVIKEPLNWPINLPIMGWVYLGVLTLLPCMLATFLWYVVLRAHEVSKQVLFTYLIPVFAAVLAYYMLGEILTIITIILGVLIFVGVALAEIDLKNNKYANMRKSLNRNLGNIK